MIRNSFFRLPDLYSGFLVTGQPIGSDYADRYFQPLIFVRLDGRMFSS